MFLRIKRVLFFFFMTRKSCTWLQRDLIRHQTHRDFLEKTDREEEKGEGG